MNAHTTSQLNRTLLILLAVAAANPATAQDNRGGFEEGEINSAMGQYAAVYLDNCAVCHGEQLEGAAQGTPLLGELRNGESQNDLERAIRDGFAQSGMPGWGATLDESDIRNLALYVAETRAGFDYADFQYNAPLVVPDETIATEHHSFRLDTVIDSLDALPFSIAPMPDGSILVTEKKLGLSIVSPDGVQSPLISGTPQTFDDSYIVALEQEWGNGWMLDVALHPLYAENQWIYLLFGDRCSDCNAASRELDGPVSMNKVVRGRIRDGVWVDQQTIWEVDVEFYGPMPDITAGGRLAFDDAGHLFISVGMKGPDNFTGIQDLSTPWGKIHRVWNNGDIPADNPFVDTPDAMASIWTYGHRSPQGLEFRSLTSEIWSTEMGPRGGDEVNRLLPGRNYGWPLFSLGMNYDGTPVSYGEQLGIEFAVSEIEQPIVDMTPSPAISSFIFYEGNAFPQWHGNLLVGSLKGRSLFRVDLQRDQPVQQETLISDLARIRDIELSNSGEIYLLLEHNSGGQIVKMTPVEN